MKRIKTWLIAITGLLCSVAVNAEDFEVNGICYDITSEENLTVAVAHANYTGAVIIPESVSYNQKNYSVTSIGGYTDVLDNYFGEDLGAFEGCAGLTSIYIPNSLKSIGNGAFRDCRGLTSVTIPSSVASVGEYAFEGCSNLKEVHISDLVAWCNISFDCDIMYIGTGGDLPDCTANPLSNSGKLYLNGEVIKDLVIPEEILIITSGAFFGCTGLTSVIIPSSVTSVGRCAFGGCKDLSSVTIPNSVTSIKYEAFLGCSNLKEIHISDLAAWCNISFDYRCNNGVVTDYNYSANPLCHSGMLYINGKAQTNLVIPDGVTTINPIVFCGYKKLNSITIPKSVVSIHYEAFYGCSNLKEVHISDLAAWCNISFNCNVPLDPYGYSLGYSANPLSHAQKLFLKGEEVKDLTISGDVTEIKNYAFYNCYGLTSVVIPNSMKSIGVESFKGCSNLKTVINFSDLNIIKNSEDNGHIAYYATKVLEADELIGDFYFKGNSLVGYKGTETNVILPEDYKGGNYSIGDGAFSDCTGLTSITIPPGVTSIGSAFDGCDSLTEVYISDLSAWCRMAFSDSKNNPLYYAKHLYLNGDKVTDLMIPEGVTTIGNYAFYNCADITSVTIPSSVTNMGSNAFSGCSALTKVNISDLAAWCGISFSNTSSNPLYHAKHLYLNGEEIKDLVIPEGVRVVGNYAFYNCADITSVTIPSSVTNMGSNAFSGCSALTKVNISDLAAWCGISFSNTNSNPLYYVKHLYLKGNKVTNLIIPEGVTSIGRYAFYNCVDVNSVTIPNSVQDIGINAFYGISIDTVYTQSTIPPALHRGNFENKVVCVPDGCGEAYREARYWNENLILDGKEHVTVHVATPGTLASEILKIGAKPANVRRLTVSGNLNDTDWKLIKNTMNNIYFMDMKGLEITMIPAYSFENNTTLVSLTLPDKVEEIGEYAFYGCSNLTFENGSVTIPASVKRVGINAFRRCGEVTAVNITDIDRWGSIEFGDVYANPLTQGAVLCLNGNVVDNINFTIAITRVGDYAFYGYRRLKSVTFSSSITGIGNCAFYNCENIKYILAPWAQPLPIDANTFYGINYANCQLEVPLMSAGYYMTSTIWEKFVNLAEVDVTGISPILLPKKDDNPVYNLRGIRMTDTDNLPAGIYIQGGKKLIVR